MYEKVNPSHPDKIADRIAGAIVDYAYTIEENPKIAVEVLIGHGKCSIICESSVDIPLKVVKAIVDRISKKNTVIDLKVVPQDVHLSDNQQDGIHCGDNGIFKGTPVTEEQQTLTAIAKDIYNRYPYDGKYIINDKKLIFCQSNANAQDLQDTYKSAIINPLGNWTGGIDVDSGATNRKLGSDMGDSITGGGLHGKDLSKADVSINIYAWLQAQKLQKPIEYFCAIGDANIDGLQYSEIVDVARNYINSIGGFEKFAEWGLIR